MLSILSDVFSVASRKETLTRDQRHRWERHLNRRAGNVDPRIGPIDWHSRRF